MTLQKAQITPEGGDPIVVMFNPDQIVYKKHNVWLYHPTNGKKLPDGSFSQSQPASLTVTLIFDGTEKGDDVAKMVDQLTSLTQVDPDLKNGTAPAPATSGAHAGGGNRAKTKSDQGRPPTVEFLWGNYLSFTAVIDTITSTFTLFLDDGTPVRAKVDLILLQIADSDVFPNQNPTSGGRTGERVHRLAPRETLDQVAYATFGQTGLWRALAAFNGIDDPMRLQAGDAILLPASVDDLKALA